LNPATQRVEVVGICHFARPRRGAGQQQGTQILSILVFANQLAYILAARAVSAFDDLLVNKGFERFWQGNVHGRHGGSPAILPKFGKPFLKNY
jgi:hypothetical protein